MPTVAEGAIFKIVAEGNVVTCSVVNRSDVTPEEGARCAEEMREVLIGQVVSRGSRYAGLVFDVSNGPSVFGPKTRASLEELFRTAEPSTNESP